MLLQKKRKCVAQVEDTGIKKKNRFYRHDQYGCMQFKRMVFKFNYIHTKVSLVHLTIIKNRKNKEE